MHTIPNRQYTREFQEAAVNQVLDGGRSVAEVARSLEMSDKSHWVRRVRRGQPFSRRGQLPRGDGRAGRAEPITDGECTIDTGQRHRKNGSGVLRERVAVRYAWIQQYRDMSPVARTCLVLGVARSG